MGDKRKGMDDNRTVGVSWRVDGHPPFFAGMERPGMQQKAERGTTPGTGGEWGGGAERSFEKSCCRTPQRHSSGGRVKKRAMASPPTHCHSNTAAPSQLAEAARGGGGGGAQRRAVEAGGGTERLADGGGEIGGGGGAGGGGAGQREVVGGSTQVVGGGVQRRAVEAGGTERLADGGRRIGGGGGAGGGGAGQREVVGGSTQVVGTARLGGVGGWGVAVGGGVHRRAAEAGGGTERLADGGRRIGGGGGAGGGGAGQREVVGGSTQVVGAARLGGVGGWGVAVGGWGGGRGGRMGGIGGVGEREVGCSKQTVGAAGQGAGVAVEGGADVRSIVRPVPASCQSSTSVVSRIRLGMGMLPTVSVSSAHDQGTFTAVDGKYRGAKAEKSAKNGRRPSDVLSFPSMVTGGDVGSFSLKGVGPGRGTGSVSGTSAGVVGCHSQSSGGVRMHAAHLPTPLVQRVRCFGGKSEGGKEEEEEEEEAAAEEENNDEIGAGEDDGDGQKRRHEESKMVVVSSGYGGKFPGPPLLLTTTTKGDSSLLQGVKWGRGVGLLSGKAQRGRHSAPQRRREGGGVRTVLSQCPTGRCEGMGNREQGGNGHDIVLDEDDGGNDDGVDNDAVNDEGDGDEVGKDESKRQETTAGTTNRPRSKQRSLRNFLWDGPEGSCRGARMRSSRVRHKVRKILPRGISSPRFEERGHGKQQDKQTTSLDHGRQPLPIFQEMDGVGGELPREATIDGRGGGGGGGRMDHGIMSRSASVVNTMAAAQKGKVSVKGVGAIEEEEGGGGVGILQRARGLCADEEEGSHGKEGGNQASEEVMAWRTAKRRKVLRHPGLSPLGATEKGMTVDGFVGPKHRKSSAGIFERSPAVVAGKGEKREGVGRLKQQRSLVASRSVGSAGSMDGQGHEPWLHHPVLSRSTVDTATFQAPCLGTGSVQRIAAVRKATFTCAGGVESTRKEEGKGQGCGSSPYPAGRKIDGSASWRGVVGTQKRRAHPVHWQATSVACSEASVHSSGADTAAKSVPVEKTRPVMRISIGQAFAPTFRASTGFAVKRESKARAGSVGGKDGGVGSMGEGCAAGGGLVASGNEERGGGEGGGGGGGGGMRREKVRHGEGVVTGWAPVARDRQARVAGDAMRRSKRKRVPRRFPESILYPISENYRTTVVGRLSEEGCEGWGEDQRPHVLDEAVDAKFAVSESSTIHNRKNTANITFQADSRTLQNHEGQLSRTVVPHGLSPGKACEELGVEGGRAAACHVVDVAARDTTVAWHGGGSSNTHHPCAGRSEVGNRNKVAEVKVEAPAYGMGENLPQGSCTPVSMHKPGCVKRRGRRMMMSWGSDRAARVSKTRPVWEIDKVPSTLGGGPVAVVDEVHSVGEGAADAVDKARSVGGGEAATIDKVCSVGKGAAVANDRVLSVGGGASAALDLKEKPLPGASTTTSTRRLSAGTASTRRKSQHIDNLLFGSGKRSSWKSFYNPSREEPGVIDRWHKEEEGENALGGGMPCSSSGVDNVTSRGHLHSHLDGPGISMEGNTSKTTAAENQPHQPRKWESKCYGRHDKHDVAADPYIVVAQMHEAVGGGSAAARAGNEKMAEMQQFNYSPLKNRPSCVAEPTRRSSRKPVPNSIFDGVFELIPYISRKSFVASSLEKPSAQGILKGWCDWGAGAEANMSCIEGKGKCDTTASSGFENRTHDEKDHDGESENKREMPQSGNMAEGGTWSSSRLDVALPPRVQLSHSTGGKDSRGEVLHCSSAVLGQGGGALWKDGRRQRNDNVDVFVSAEGRDVPVACVSRPEDANDDDEQVRNWPPDPDVQAVDGAPGKEDFLSVAQGMTGDSGRSFSPAPVAKREELVVEHQGGQGEGICLEQVAGNGGAAAPAEYDGEKKKVTPAGTLVVRGSVNVLSRPAEDTGHKPDKGKRQHVLYAGQCGKCGKMCKMGKCVECKICGRLEHIHCTEKPAFCACPLEGWTCNSCRCCHSCGVNIIENGGYKHSARSFTLCRKCSALYLRDWYCTGCEKASLQSLQALRKQ
ncbi:hypothetical protein CBR_g18931 [Chara braunii]|uniref:Uncharacterized protein n=1 Tax=Chara braunii TaxID=69332 RepID=A0A388KWV0_CHABU|nr:hypothetical protein CBR_g18931 [Chara braunii]|eukprot:GBG74521.1 hypothetical protein CBR_g18931 [Chara braunii]